VTRTPPSQADQDLIESLASKGVRVTATQLERWRSGGYLPANMREGLGRGAGSRSEVVAGATEYLEVLACLAGQGRSMRQVMLTMFMAGAVQPERCSAGDALGKTYEAAVRRAFRQWIDHGDKEWNRIATRLAADGEDRSEAVDNAFAQAETIARRKSSKKWVRLDNTAAGLSGTRPRTSAELKAAEEQGLLVVTGLIPEPERDDDNRSLEEIWHTGLVPLDVNIWAQPRCTTCASRTTKVATSPEGRRDILDSASFAELNRARAIGGAVCMLVASIRDAVLNEPSDGLRGAAALISNTVFRILLRQPLKVSPQVPDSIVPSTLFFLDDCRWLRSGAALLTQVAVNQMPSVQGDTAMPAAVVGTMVETAGRAGMLRLFRNGAGMLLAADGLTEAAKFLKLRDRTPDDQP
jgi:hypothetical protein